MGYAKIFNLYKSQEILVFKEIYALEKIHGTSAHIKFLAPDVLTFFSGGSKHDAFVALFNQDELKTKFAAFGYPEITVYGEAYGGKLQGMSKTYGAVLKFIVFEVQIGDLWLVVPNAEDAALKLGLEFVSYARIPATLEAIDAERDKSSVQAQRNGITEPCVREGVVLRPIIEVRTDRDSRVIAKHKRAEFAERQSTPNVDPTKREIMENADKIAMEWCTPMRLQHVLDKLPDARGYKDIPVVITAMLEDIRREGKGEFIDAKPVAKAIGAKTVKMFKEYLNSIIKE